MNVSTSTLFRRFGGVLCCLLATTWASHAQIYDPVQWHLELDSSEAPPGSTVLGRLTATVQSKWHVYSTTTPEGIPLDVGVAESDAISEWKAYQPEPDIVFDPNFQAEVEWYTGTAEFLIEMRISDDASGEQAIEANVRYGACDDRQCLPPKRKSAQAKLSVRPDATVTVFAIPAEYQPTRRNEGPRPVDSSAVREESVTNTPIDFAPSDQGLVSFSLLALGVGFLAILTPCVFPMIPIYMGSFMGGGERPWRSVLLQAGTFCLGVIVLFTALGGALSAFLGPFGLSQIGSNVWVNLFIATVMFVFALSMLGAFELNVPSSWTTGASARSTGTGIAATLMLSLVFTLASFACTGPFIGTLLAGSVGFGGAAYPVIGMTMFSTGLATPFFLLALFPALMNRLPRSGGWLATTKRTAGLVIVAVGLKYLANVDQVSGSGLLTRERFLAIWIVLFAAAGLYLWGILRFADDGTSTGIGLVRLGIGMGLLAFAISLVPGMFGGRLGELDAHVPEATGAGLADTGGGLSWIKDDHSGAAAKARAEDKTLLISFTGYACSNCKWMKSNMFTRPEVQDLLRGMVLVELYTDGFDEASEQHQKLQVEQFRSSSIPYYALVQPDGSVAATFSGQTRDVEEFRAFLSSAP